MNQAVATDISVLINAKKEAKEALAKELGWTPEARQPLVCLPMELTNALGGELFKELIPGLLSLPVRLLIVGKGAASYGKMATELHEKHPQTVAIIPGTKQGLDAMTMAADIALFLSGPSKTGELSLCKKHGVIAVAPVCDELENYNQNQESCDSFLYEGSTVWHCFAAIVRALETYRFPYDWKTIQKNSV